MRIVRGLPSYRSEERSSVVALGSFDGVHLGHQRILDTAAERARALGIDSVACTFDPHPLDVLQPDRAPTPITTLEERLALIADRGLDTAVVIPFTRELSLIEPERFIDDVIVGTLRAREVVVGFNHRFGREARGDADLLSASGQAHDFSVRVVPPLTIHGVTVSSTAIRTALRGGDLDGGRHLLGRPYSVAGAVVRGEGRGRRLGFPTANIQPDRAVLLPTGVYAGFVRILPATATEMGPEDIRWPRASRDDHKGVVNIGVRPTFGGTEAVIEAHLLGFDGDLYSRRLRIWLLHRERDEQKFPDVAALRRQIAEDVAAAERILS